MSNTVYKKRVTVVLDGVRYDIRGQSDLEINEKIERKKKALMYVDNGITVKEWARLWLTTYRNTSLKTYRDIEARINQKILPFIGSKKLIDVRPSDCQAIMDNMTGYSMDRINKVHNTLYQMFKAAQGKWYIDRNPAESLIKPDGEDGNGRAFTPTEKKYLLKVCKDHPYGDWALTMLYCGLRPGETARVKWKHLHAGCLFIDGTKTKNAKRTVPVPDSLYKRLDAKRGNPDEYIFTRTSNHLYQSGITRNWNAIRREMQIAAGTRVYRNELIEPFALDNEMIAYCCRHTFATELKDSQMPYAIMQELLGHASGGITDRYLHGTKSSVEVAREYLNRHRHWRNRRLVACQFVWQHGKISLKNKRT